MDLENGSGSSKHSESQPEIIDGRDHREPYPKLRVRIASSDHLDVRPEIIDESGSSEHSGSPPKVGDGSNSSKHTTSQQNAGGNEGGLLFPAVRLGSSSSSSASSLEDLIPVKTNEDLDPNASSIYLDGADKDTQQKLKVREIDIPSESSSNSEESENGSPGPTGTSPVSDITHESRIHTMSPTQSPVVQVMERTSGYDPHRIPSTIFERPKTPMDWSTASNDSLFSIHVGNSSFSKDSFFMPGDLVKSGELTKSGELIVFSSPPPLAAMHRDTKSSIPALGTGQQPVRTENIEAAGVTGVNIEDAKTEAAENSTKEKNPSPTLSWNFTATASHSDESRDSITSFAFPIRKKKCKWPSCYCSNCSCALCYCSWPSCFFRWPSHSCRWPRCHFRRPSSCFSNCSWAFCCSNCNWTFCGCPKCSHSLAFCYCWNCSKKGCCHSSPNLADGIRSSSAKASDEEQQSQPSALSVNKRSSCCCCCMHRCHCISCWPWGCTNRCHCC